MLFNSFEFLIFFITVTVLYFILPHKYRWVLLLTASCIFYMFFIPVYILILIFTIVIDFFAGLLIERATGRRRRRWLIVSLCANIGVLAFFKYFNFLNDNLTEFLGFLDRPNPVPYLDIILPIGLSFHTFQAMSYTIEIYRGHQRAERHPGIFALYVMFYPQLVAGPIERPQNLLHQFREKHAFDIGRLFEGLKLMSWGLFKKVCVADRLGMMVDAVYADPEAHFGLAPVLATAFFSFQLYCDFSGYSEMAIGAAKVMGFTLMKNFNTPFFSQSLSELWKRWHISLSSWFRDYVYISLGGNRRTSRRRYFNLVFTFSLSGLWHGANWGFAFWGFQQGMFLAIGAWTHKLRQKLASRFDLKLHAFPWKLAQMLFVFFLFCLGMAFFRAANFSGGLTILVHSLSGWGDGHLLASMNASAAQMAVTLLLLACLILVEWQLRERTIPEWLATLPLWASRLFLFVLLLVVLNLGVFHGTNFIYFQF